MMRERISRLPMQVALFVLGMMLWACGQGKSDSHVDLIPFDTLMANTQQYAREYVCTEGVHLDGFEVTGLAATVHEREGYVELAEPVIWLEGVDLLSRVDCARTETTPPFALCRTIVCGVFEADGGYGHGAGYAYQLRGRDVMVDPGPALQPPMPTVTAPEGRAPLAEPPIRRSAPRTDPEPQRSSPRGGLGL